MIVVDAARVLKVAGSIVCLAAALLLGLYAYGVGQSRQLSKRVAKEVQVIRSREGLQTLRSFAGLAPIQLDCGKGALLISMAYVRCDVAGSIQARVQPEGVVTYEGSGDGGYMVDGGYRTQYIQRLSSTQREQLNRLVSKWPNFNPEAETSRAFHLRRMTAMLVCDDGRQYGIPLLGDRQASDLGPEEEFLHALGAMAAKDPNAREIACIH